MNIKLQRKKRARTGTIYYNVFVDGEYKCILRVSDHPKPKVTDNKKGLFFPAGRPKDVKIGVLKAFVREHFENLELQKKIPTQKPTVRKDTKRLKRK